MLRNERNLSFNRSEFSTFYTDFRGVELTGDECGISQNRLAYSENLYRDYDGDGAGILESFPGFRKIAALGDTVHGIAGFVGGDGNSYLVVHAGTKVYRFPVSSRDVLGTLTEIAIAADRKSRTFLSDGALFLLDGERLLRITESDAKAVGCGAGEAEPYVPTTYRNGKEYEQRNLLTQKFAEEYTLTDAEYYSYGSDGLNYRILDPVLKECALVGYPSGFSGELFVPSSVTIGGERYTVAEIADTCFQNNTALTKVTAANGIRRVGTLSFSGCTALTEAIFPDSVTELGYGAFNNCVSLTKLRVGTGLSLIGNSVISFCSSLTTFDYGGTQTAFESVSGRSALGSTTILYNVPQTALKISLPIRSPCLSVSGVTVNGSAKTYTAHTNNGATDAVILAFSDRKEIDGAVVTISGSLKNGTDTGTLAGGFLRANPALTESPSAALLGCTVAECFDGHVFLSGNPAFPNVVFFSARGKSGKNDPTYFGEYNYFSDGVGRFPVGAMLSVGSSLAVFKKADDGGGSIFYHTAKETGVDLVPKIYPVTYVHSGIDCSGEALCFADDPVFLCKNGLCALDKPNISAERSVSVRSKNVNYSLLNEDLKNASLVSWCGYLAVGCGEHVYLADSRSVCRHADGGLGYEWFYLSGFGTYEDDRPVYRYASFASSDDLLIDEKQGERIPDGIDVYSRATDDETEYYVTDDDRLIAAEKTEERTGGTFSPATAFCSFDDLLFFGTDSGDVCIVNTDLRGKPPASLSQSSDFDADAYAALMGRRIHPSFYHRAGHAMRVALRTKNDNCGIPHLQKSTVKNSLVLKLRCFSGGTLLCEVRTDRTGCTGPTAIPSSVFGFDDLDFSRLSLSADDAATVALAEKERRWVDKQISVYTDEYCAPIGVYSISYRFTVAGRIRR